MRHAITPTDSRACAFCPRCCNTGRELLTHGHRVAFGPCSECGRSPPAEPDPVEDDRGVIWMLCLGWCLFLLAMVAMVLRAAGKLA